LTGQFDHTFQPAASDGDGETITLLHLPFIFVGRVNVHRMSTVPAPR
jgi:hypothetical protein